MPMRLLIAIAATLLACASGAQATPVETTIDGTYTAVDTGKGPYLPTINDDGGSFLTSPFSETLTLGTTTAPTTFLQVAPANGSNNVGTVTGSIAIAMTLLGPSNSAVTGLTVSGGGLGATLSHGTIDFDANYAIYYGNQTDCLTWDGATCTPTNNTTTIGETLTVTFADGASAALALYNWSDWDIAPSITFSLISGPRGVAEPASLAVFASAVSGLWLLLRRRQRLNTPDRRADS